MKLLRTFQILMLMLLADLVVSCCDCPEAKMTEFSYCAVELQNIDNTGFEPEVSTADTLSKDAYGFQIILTTQRQICQLRNASLFSPAAFAMKSCNCALDYDYPRASIERVEITALEQFDDTISAGSDITSRFMWYQRFEFTKIEHIPSQFYTGYSQDSVRVFMHDIIMVSPPSKSGKQQFEISIHLADGKVLSAVSPKVFLK